MKTATKEEKVVLIQEAPLITGSQVI